MQASLGQQKYWSSGKAMLSSRGFAMRLERETAGKSENLSFSRSPRWIANFDF